MLEINYLLLAVDPQVHVTQVNKGDYACSKQARPVDVVEHVVWINSLNYRFFVYLLIIIEALKF